MSVNTKTNSFKVVDNKNTYSLLNPSAMKQMPLMNSMVQMEVNIYNLTDLRSRMSLLQNRGSIMFQALAHLVEMELNHL